MTCLSGNLSLVGICLQSDFADSALNYASFATICEKTATNRPTDNHLGASHAVVGEYPHHDRKGVDVDCGENVLEAACAERTMVFVMFIFV